MKEKIDVIIPAYNAENFIDQALESVMNQTLKPNKIIVVDDGSTDKTINVIQNFMKKNLIEIKLLSQANKGPNAARNMGIINSDAQFLAFLDADDVWEKDKLEKQFNLFMNSKFKHLGLVYCDYDLIDQYGNKINKRILKIKSKPALKGFVFKKMFDEMQITGSCSGVLINTIVFSKVGMFDETLKVAEDWDMWIRISKFYQIDFVDEILTHIRLHRTNIHNNQIYMAEHFLNFVKKWTHKEKKPVFTNKLAVKSLDYLFRPLFLLKFGNIRPIYRSFNTKLSNTEKKKLFAKTKGNICLFIFYSLPFYIIKQIVKIVNLIFF